jgi:hypothetical protein
MEVYNGRRVRMYKCRLRSAVIRFTNGRFALKYNTEENGDSATKVDDASVQAEAA